MFPFHVVGTTGRLELKSVDPPAIASSVVEGKTSSATGHIDFVIEVEVLVAIKMAKVVHSGDNRDAIMGLFAVRKTTHRHINVELSSRAEGRAIAVVRCRAKPAGVW